MAISLALVASVGKVVGLQVMEENARFRNEPVKGGGLERHVRDRHSYVFEHVTYKSGSCVC